ncbi:MAG: hypothetical protein AB7O57_17570 [Hyphomicrobiaceae bacterium]
MIFVSTAPSDSTLIKHLEADIVQREPEKAIAAVRRDQVGEPLDDDMFPTAIWGDNHSQPMSRLPHLFYANGYWCISELARTIIEAAELGRTRIRPVQIFQRDRITPVTGRFYCLNIAEPKAALAPDASQGLRRNPYAKVPTFNSPWFMADGNIAAKRWHFRGWNSGGTLRFRGTSSSRVASARHSSKPGWPGHSACSLVGSSTDETSDRPPSFVPLKSHRNLNHIIVRTFNRDGPLRESRFT